jgi:hypothetical protein
VLPDGVGGTVRGHGALLGPAWVVAIARVLDDVILDQGVGCPAVDGEETTWGTAADAERARVGDRTSFIVSMPPMIVGQYSTHVASPVCHPRPTTKSPLVFQVTPKEPALWFGVY